MFVGVLMVSWPKYILTFICIFTFGALGLESPREGAIKTFIIGEGTKNNGTELKGQSNEF